jgi:hypothetical protein
MGIVAAKALHQDGMEIEYQITKYREDESLMIYRSSRRYIAHGLLPYNQSQALHPAPYPDSANPTPDEKMQIFNAWWNGYLLGYPEYFVDSYCESFHNGLDAHEKSAQSRAAKSSVVKFLSSIRHKQEVIRKGLDSPISEDQFKTVIAASSLYF